MDSVETVWRQCGDSVETVWDSGYKDAGPTWWMTAHACSSEMGAEKEWRIWSRLRQCWVSNWQPLQPGQPLSSSISPVSMITAVRQSPRSCQELLTQAGGIWLRISFLCLFWQLTAGHCVIKCNIGTRYGTLSDQTLNRGMSGLTVGVRYQTSFYTYLDYNCLTWIK